ncbi:GNAT family N-acetyltransferase [Mycobacterium sp.]|uniref:GNAT family N-acetyltransferase n=1 Tax=Mycobacterium sp. TaxID=1785 RepID=UPI003BAA6694
MDTSQLRIVVDDLTDDVIIDFLQSHIEEMRSVSPPESTHALNLDELRKPDVTLWSVYTGAQLIGCGGIKKIDAGHGEIKSMRTAPTQQGNGVGSFLLRHLIDQATQRGYSRLSLETGSYEFFRPARALYTKHGFTYCGPFGDYRLDPNSVFMTKILR